MIQLNQKPYRIGFLLIDGFALMGYTTAVEPLRAANHIYAQHFANIPTSPLYEWVHIPSQNTHAYSSSGAIFEGDSNVGDDIDLDLVLVIAGGDPFTFKDEKTFAWLRKLAAKGVIIGGVSGGPVVLVKAGLMQGRRMTVHWEHANGLNDIASNIALSRTLYVMDRDRLTCAGGVAPLDLMHAILTDHHGAPFARKVSDWFLHTVIRPPSGPQKAGIIDQYNLTHPVMVEAIEVMANHIGDPLNLDDIAGLVHCTPRHLNRLFQQTLKITTMRFYRNIRLDHAMQLLKQTSLSLTEIAYDVGFSSSAHFSRAFREYFDKSPREIR